MAIQIMLKGSKKDKLGKKELPIFIRYSHDGTGFLKYTGKKIRPAEWNDEKSEPRNSYKGGAVNLSRYLEKLRGEIAKAQTDLQAEGEIPTAHSVKQRLELSTGVKTRTKETVLIAWKTFLRTNAGEKAQKTLQNEKSSLNSFEDYLDSVNKTAITLEGFTKDLLGGYEVYLSKNTLNTKSKKLKHLKAFLRSCNHPLTDAIKFKERPGNKIFLSQTELALFQSHDFTENLRLDQVRDLFVLQCHTGLRVSDLKRLSQAHINESLVIRAQKNKETIKMPVTPSIKALLNKYNNVLPEISDQKYNLYLKDVAKAVLPDTKIEITEYRGGKTIHKTRFKWQELSSHDAVRTFITLKAQLGMPISSIAVLTGKTVAVILKNYLGKDEGQAQKDAIKYDFASMMVG